MTTAVTRIDPLRSCPNGRYEDERVIVLATRSTRIAVSERTDGRLEIQHGLGLGVDDDLGEPLAHALAPFTDDHDVFARAFTGIVLTSHRDALTAWDGFYRHSLARLGRGSGYSEIYRHALELLPRSSVLDLGCSFGFLALHLAARGTAVVACDVDPGTTALLTLVARRLAVDVDVVTSSATTVGRPNGSADAVALLHVLEHVDDATGRELLAEAMRIARHRVVVAVPFEAQATALFGHLRRFTLHDLARLGAESGWAYDVHEHHGGWLVLNRTALHHGHSSG